MIPATRVDIAASELSHVLNTTAQIKCQDFLPLPAWGPTLSWPASCQACLKDAEGFPAVFLCCLLPLSSSAPSLTDHNCIEDNQDLVSYLYFLLSQKVSSE